MTGTDSRTSWGLVLGVACATVAVVVGALALLRPSHASGGAHRALPPRRSRRSRGRVGATSDRDGTDHDERDAAPRPARRDRSPAHARANTRRPSDAPVRTQFHVRGARSVGPHRPRRRRFPTARKVALLRNQRGHGKVIVVNAMEGEPEAHKDRTLLSTNPHLVLDGAECLAMMIGAKTVAVCVPARQSDRRAPPASARSMSASLRAAQGTDVRVARRRRGATSPARSRRSSTGSTTTSHCPSTAPARPTCCAWVAVRRWSTTPRPARTWRLIGALRGGVVSRAGHGREPRQRRWSP